MAGVALFDLHAVPEEQTGLALREELVAYVRETLGASTEAKMIVYVEPPSCNRVRRRAGNGSKTCAQLPRPGRAWIWDRRPGWRCW